MADDLEVNYDEEIDNDIDLENVGQNNLEGTSNTGGKKGNYHASHSAGFKDFFLKEPILRSIVESGFEHPSEVQQECIPQAILGQDILCQAKSGYGKTAVFVLSTLHLLDTTSDDVTVLILVNVRELAFQIFKEYKRFSNHLDNVRVDFFFGQVDRKLNIKQLKENKPQIVVGTPGRIKDLVDSGHLKVDKVKFFILDECDKLLEQLDMRRDVQRIFQRTPFDKQVMMFSATLPKTTKEVCKKMVKSDQVVECFIEDERKLVLHGLVQYYVKLNEAEKNSKLVDILDNVQFNQVVIFVNSGQRAEALAHLLRESNFPAKEMHGQLPGEERIKRYNEFKGSSGVGSQIRILVSTDVFGRGIDIQKVNLVINYDFPKILEKEKNESGESVATQGQLQANADQYLHRVGRAGRFNTKGLAISFVTTQDDADVLKIVQDRFEVRIPEMPDEIDPASYGASAMG